MVKVEIISHTPDPEAEIATAARACFVDQDYEAIRENLKPETVKRILTTVIVKGHHSVLEHANFTFAISGVSRVLTHQLVRHRIASYSQLSQQRSDASDLDFVTPPEIRRDADLAAAYETAMTHCRALYREMINRSVPLGSARYVLPSGFTTRIITTMNARSLFNLLALRECAAEEWEFRLVATLMHKELKRVAPLLFRLAGPRCATDQECLEGEVGQNCALRRKNGAELMNTRELISSTLSMAEKG